MALSVVKRRRRLRRRLSQLLPVLLVGLLPLLPHWILCTAPGGHAAIEQADASCCRTLALAAEDAARGAIEGDCLAHCVDTAEETALAASRSLHPYPYPFTFMASASGAVSHAAAVTPAHWHAAIAGSELSPLDLANSRAPVVLIC